MSLVYGVVQIGTAFLADRHDDETEAEAQARAARADHDPYGEDW